MLSLNGVTMETTIAFLGVLLMMAKVDSSKSEYELVNALLHNYSTNVRPVMNNSEKVVVKLGIALNQIIDLDERNQILTVKMFMRLSWVDEHLTWNESQYDGLKKVSIQAKQIWRPDITLYTDASASDGSIGGEYAAVIQSSGKVSWNFPTVAMTTCSIQVQFFPWDQQACPLKYGSWSFDGFSVDIVNSSESGDLSTFIKNGEWDMIGLPFKRHEVFYSCCPEPYPDMTFWIVMRRKSLYYTFNLLLPCLFITATTILVFYLPPESGEKISLGMTGLLALTVFLLLVAETLPPQSETIPLIGQYFAGTIVLLSMSTALTVVVLNIFHRGEFGKEVPRWIKTIVLSYLARILLLKGTIDANASHKQARNNNKKMYKVEDLPNGDVESRNITREVTVVNREKTDTDKTLLDIRNFLEEIQSRHADKVNDDGCRTDWMLVAIVLDRLFFLLFVLLSLIITFSILLSYPNYEDFHLDSVIE